VLRNLAGVLQEGLLRPHDRTCGARHPFGDLCSEIFRDVSWTQSFVLTKLKTGSLLRWARLPHQSFATSMTAWAKACGQC